MAGRRDRGMNVLKAVKRRSRGEFSRGAHLPKKYLSDRLAEDIRLLNIASPKNAGSTPLTWTGPPTSARSREAPEALFDGYSSASSNTTREWQGARGEPRDPTFCDADDEGSDNEASPGIRARRRRPAGPPGRWAGRDSGSFVPPRIDPALLVPKFRGSEDGGGGIGGVSFPDIPADVFSVGSAEPHSRCYGGAVLGREVPYSPTDPVAAVEGKPDLPRRFDADVGTPRLRASLSLDEAAKEGIVRRPMPEALRRVRAEGKADSTGITGALRCGRPGLNRGIAFGGHRQRIEHHANDLSHTDFIVAAHDPQHVGEAGAASDRTAHAGDLSHASFFEHMGGVDSDDRFNFFDGRGRKRHGPSLHPDNLSGSTADSQDDSGMGRDVYVRRGAHSDSSEAPLETLSEPEKGARRRNRLLRSQLGPMEDGAEADVDTALSEGELPAMSRGGFYGDWRGEESWDPTMEDA